MGSEIVAAAGETTTALAAPHPREAIATTVAAREAPIATAVAETAPGRHRADTVTEAPLLGVPTTRRMMASLSHAATPEMYLKYRSCLWINLTGTLFPLLHIMMTLTDLGFSSNSSKAPFGDEASPSAFYQCHLRLR
jgi:hypothetical protein